MDHLIVIFAVVLYLLFFAAVIAIYIAPTYIAFKNQHPNRWAIMAVNIGLGGTGIAWIGSLVWALNKVHLSSAGSNGGESGLNIFANDPVTVRMEPGFRAASPPSDPEARLQQLKRLHESGAIDVEEHARLRRDFLNTLTR